MAALGADRCFQITFDQQPGPAGLLAQSRATSTVFAPDAMVVAGGAGIDRVPTMGAQLPPATLYSALNPMLNRMVDVAAVA
jgi:hypothetical protein